MDTTTFLEIYFDSNGCSVCFVEGKCADSECCIPCAEGECVKCTDVDCESGWCWRLHTGVTDGITGHVTIDTDGGPLYSCVELDDLLAQADVTSDVDTIAEVRAVLPAK